MPGRFFGGPLCKDLDKKLTGWGDYTRALGQTTLTRLNIPFSQSSGREETENTPVPACRRIRKCEWFPKRSNSLTATFNAFS